jgi:cyclic pyranopterin phosphate synthase
MPNSNSKSKPNASSSLSNDVLSCALNFNDIFRICVAATQVGIRKFKITGGEPLVREGVTDLIGRLKHLDKTLEVTLTTNGVLAERYARELKNVGIDRVNISLDSLNREHYLAITGSDSLDKVLSGISALLREGIPVRINTVLQKGINEADAWDIISLAKDNPIDVRFIEMMPIGEGRSFEPVLNSEIINSLGALIERESKLGNGPAVYYRAKGYKGSIGFISALSNRFCDGCNRIRLTSTGFLKGCLCYDTGVDLSPLLRYNDGNRLSLAIKAVIESKPGRHSFEDINKITETKDMNKIGG